MYQILRYVKNNNDDDNDDDEYSNFHEQNYKYEGHRLKTSRRGYLFANSVGLIVLQ